MKEERDALQATVDQRANKVKAILYQLVREYAAFSEVEDDYRETLEHSISDDPESQSRKRRRVSEHSESDA